MRKKIIEPKLPQNAWIAWFLGLMTLLPFIQLAPNQGAVVSIEGSEYPVKLWGYIHFSLPERWFGGGVSTVSFPETGALNNPDIFASIWFWLWNHWLGGATTFSILLILVMGLNILSGFFLSLQCGIDKWSSACAGVFFGWQPILISYAFASNITDVAHMWPYAFGFAFLIRARFEQEVKDVRLAGILLGMGFVTCPYNFVLFIPWLPFLLLWMFHRNRQFGWDGLRVLTWNCGVIVGLYGLRMLFLMKGTGSLVDKEVVDSVRHVYPFDGLMGERPTRFTAFLSEMLGLQNQPVIVMEQVARFVRHFQWSLMSILLLSIGLFSNICSKLFRIEGKEHPELLDLKWLCGVGVLLGVGAAIGPFATVNSMLELNIPLNPLYYWAYYLPMGKMILEPFRYVLLAGLCMTPLVAMGIACIQRKDRWFGVLCSLLMVVEIGWRNPMFPLPVQNMQADPRMKKLDISEGGVVHLPFFRSGSNLFDRSHFLSQMSHHHPIADPIMGFPSPFMIQNSLLCPLLHAETVTFPMEFFQCTRGSLRKGLLELQEKGVSALVLDPGRYAPEDWMAVQAILVDVSLSQRDVQGLIVMDIPKTQIAP